MDREIVKWYSNRILKCLGEGNTVITTVDARDYHPFEIVEIPYRIFNPDDIVDVEFYPPATKMTFRDGTVTTAVAQEGDEFNKEVGMMVCIMKYVFIGKGYNNMFRKWIKNADRREAAKTQEIEKQKEAKAIKERQAAKEAKRRAARAERAKEREIEIQKEAYVRAMREVQSDKTEGADV